MEGSQKQQERVSPYAQALFKSLLVSHLLLSHWPEQFKWLSPNSRDENRDSTA